jgi:DNA-binding transcriptional LysR family regulator
MPDLNDMAAFAGVVEAGSFSAAAQRIEASKSRVSKAVMRVERALGARLLNRSTRRLSLTEAGEAFYAHCRRMLDEARLAQQAVSRHQASPLGVLKLSAPVAFGALKLSAALPAFMARHPRLGVDLSLSDQAPDFFATGLDLALLAGQPPAPGLAARRIARLPQMLCASPAYLKSHGAPHRPADLARHNCLHAGAPWRLGGEEIAVNGSLRTHDRLAAWQAARAGLGIALLPRYLAADDVASGRLVAVLERHLPPAEELVAVRLPGIFVAPKVRALVDYLGERFGARPRQPVPAPARSLRAAAAWNPAASRESPSPAPTAE